MNKLVLILVLVLVSILPVAIATKEPTQDIGCPDCVSIPHNPEEKQICDPEIEICNVITENPTSESGGGSSCKYLKLNQETEARGCFKIDNKQYRINKLNFLGYNVLVLKQKEKWMGATGITEGSTRFLMDGHLQLRLLDNKVYVMQI